MPKSNPSPANPAERPGGRVQRIKRLLVLMLALLAIINLAFFVLAVQPSGQSARHDREALHSMEADLKARRESVAKLRDINSRLGEARQQDMDFYNKEFLPRATGFSTVMDELEKLAKGTHVYTGTVGYTVTDLANQPGVTEVDITTTVEGEYGNIVQFVNQVERDPLLLLIDQIAAVGGQTQPQPGQRMPVAAAAATKVPVRLSLRLVTFFRGQ